jgi:hypothetical protein
VRKINWDTTSVVFYAALAFALLSGPSSVIAQTNNTGPKGQNCVAMGGTPGVVKAKKQGNCIATGGASSSSVLRKGPQKKDGSFKVEIEGVKPKPNARSR